jgi:hypothetical protein
MKWRSQELAPQIGGGCLIDGPSTPVDPHIFVEGTPTLMGIAHCMVSADQWAISDPRSQVRDRSYALFWLLPNQITRSQQFRRCTREGELSFHRSLMSGQRE